MSTISVVTPVVDGGQKYLSEAYESIMRQELPEGWSWQWVVQEDGMTGRPTAALPVDPRITTGLAPRGGAAVARTMALGRVRGSLVRSLDADDLLPDGALARDIAALERHHEYGWCISACIDLMPDGSQHPGPYDPPPGPLKYATLFEAFEAHRFPVVGTNLTVRSPLLYALGGWPAIPAWEALALVLLCSAVSPGYMLSEPGGIYRKHPAQMTAQPGYKDMEFQDIRLAITSRLDALRNSGWTWKGRQ